MPKYPIVDKCSDKKTESQYKKEKTTADDKLHLNQFFKSSELYVVSSDTTDDKIQISLRASNAYGICPYCGSTSHQVHSTYIRKLTDLPILGNKVSVLLGVRKFFCKNKICSKKTFAEQPGDQIYRYRRRTKRCETTIGELGIKMSAVNTSMVLKSMNIPLSSSTVLRAIYRIDLPEMGEITELGVDDWAFRKGLVYGSILVDMKKGNVIDLLADRETERFESWIREHTEVTLVSRDRSTNYSSAISNTGRDITEVADRFHLIKNLSDCITKVISENYTEVRNALCPQEIPFIKEMEPADIPTEKPTDERITISTKTRKEDSRLKMFNEVKELQTKGFKIAAIAKRLHITRQTVRKYKAYEQLPDRRSCTRNEYYKFDIYVEDEYAKGKYLSHIHKDIQNMGFKGSLTPFHDHYRYLCQNKAKSSGCKSRIKPIDNRTPLIPVKAISATIFKTIRGCKFNQESTILIDKLMGIEWFETLYNGTKSFYEIIMGDKKEVLKLWIEEYKHTTIAKLKTFITGIILDMKAVENAIVYPISNGVVEGLVNKLKTIKRMMYGRAGLELLKRKMVLSNRKIQLN